MRGLSLSVTQWIRKMKGTWKLELITGIRIEKNSKKAKRNSFLNLQAGGPHGRRLSISKQFE